MPSRPLTRALVWLLVLLLPLQGIAATVLAARGPSHVHREAPAPSKTADILRAFGHFHHAAAAERHHHSFGDTSVVQTADGASLEDDSSGAGSTLAVFVALLPQPLSWAAPARRGAGVAHRPWAWVTHVPGGIERPPRSVAAR